MAVRNREWYENEFRRVQRDHDIQMNRGGRSRAKTKKAPVDLALEYASYAGRLEAIIEGLLRDEEG